MVWILLACQVVVSGYCLHIINIMAWQLNESSTVTDDLLGRETEMKERYNSAKSLPICIYFICHSPDASYAS